MARDRHLQHTKGLRTTTGRGAPSPNEGSDGDMTIRSLGRGLFLFVKFGNFWYHVSELVSYNPKKVHPHGIKPISTFPGTVLGSGGAGNLGIKAGSKFIFSSINTKDGITGNNYIQSGTTQTPSDLGNTYARNFINFNVGDVGKMLTLDENGSGSRVLLSHSGGALEAKKIYISDSYGSSLGDTHISGSGADELKITVGGESMLHFIESTTNTMESQEIAEYLIRSGTTEDPILHLKNTTNDATGPTLKLNNAKAGGGNFGADDDVLGTISFDGEDDAGNAQQYANINSTIDVAANGQESGKLSIQVASHDGGLEHGLILTGGSLDTEVDVTIGTGVASMTTIAGDLQINGGQIKTAGAIVFNSGGALTLDAHDGSFIAMHAGTQFSATNSAYAGMILGYTRLQGDLTSSTTFEIQDALTVEDDSHKVTFITPPSELVEIELSCFINVLSTDTNIDVGLSTADTSGYAAAAAHLEYDFGGVFLSDDEAIDAIHTVKFIVGASELNAVGVSNTFWIGFSTAGATKGAYVAYGLRAAVGLAYPPMVIKATALPATIYDGL